MASFVQLDIAKLGRQVAVNRDYITSVIMRSDERVMVKLSGGILPYSAADGDGWYPAGYGVGFYRMVTGMDTPVQVIDMSRSGLHRISGTDSQGKELLPLQYAVLTEDGSIRALSFDGCNDERHYYCSLDDLFDGCGGYEIISDEGIRQRREWDQDQAVDSDKPDA